MSDWIPNGIKWLQASVGSAGKYWPIQLSIVSNNADHLGNWVFLHDVEVNHVSREPTKNSPLQIHIPSRPIKPRTGFQLISADSEVKHTESFKSQTPPIRSKPK